MSLMAKPSRGPDGAEGGAALLAAPVLSVEEVTLTGRDLVAAGAVSGRWTRLEADLLAGLALCEADPPRREDVDAAVREFRYARRLTSGQDFRRWLDQRRLRLPAVHAAVARELARRGGGGAAAAPDRADRAAALAALEAEAVCTGALRDCGWWLADRLLVGSAHDDAVTDPRLPDVAARERDLLATMAFPEPEDVRVQRLARILAADAAFAASAADVVSAGAVERFLNGRRLDWLTFELEGLRCPTQHAGAEAAMQLRDDGRPLPDVAGAAGLEAERQTLVLERAPAPLRALLVAATPGDVVGPAEVETCHEVWVVRRRTPPDAGDPEMVERATAALIAVGAQHRRAGRVRWHDRD